MPCIGKPEKGGGPGERSGEGATVYKVTGQLRLRQDSLIWKSRRSIFHERWCATPCLTAHLPTMHARNQLQQASSSKQGQHDATAR